MKANHSRTEAWTWTSSSPLLILSDRERQRVQRWLCITIPGLKGKDPGLSCQCKTWDNDVCLPTSRWRPLSCLDRRCGSALGMMVASFGAVGLFGEPQTCSDGDPEGSAELRTGWWGWGAGGGVPCLCSRPSGLLKNLPAFPCAAVESKRCWKVVRRAWLWVGHWGRCLRSKVECWASPARPFK